MASKKSGYKYNFVLEPSDALKCMICLEVAEEPWQHSTCGRLFCNKCLDLFGRRKPCPNCRMANPAYFEDNKSKREIQLLEVECDHKGEGCEWKSTVASIADHLTTCNFSLLPCSKKCKNDDGEVKYFMRKDLDTHIRKKCPNRDYECKYCGEKGTYASIEIHDETCTLKIVPCTNPPCPKEMQRQHLFKHIQFECEFTKVKCKYQSIGCKEKLLRGKMKEHEHDEQIHLKIAIDTVAFLKEKCSTAVTFRITDYEAKREKNTIFHSPAFYTSSNGYHMKIRIHCNGNGVGKGTHLSIFACLVEGKHDLKLKWPFTGKVQYELLNQNVDDDRIKNEIYFSTKDDIKIGTDKYGLGTTKAIPLSVLSPDQPYLKNDTLYFRVSVVIENHKPWLECIN